VLFGSSVPEAKLPFQASDESPAQTFEDAVAHAQAVQGPARRPVASLGSTVDDTSRPTGSALPFLPNAPPRASTPPQTAAEASPQSAYPPLTVTQYASLRVEMHRSPERLAQTLARYRVPPGAQAALEEHWRNRFEADPGVRSAFLNACARYNEWLDAHPPGPPGSSRG
jgi:hypothetical protein